MSRPRVSWTVGTLLICAGISVVALAVPASLGYDPWAWLVWGREIVRLDLDTTGGPSWKPLPVLFAVPVAWIGDPVAPVLWMVISRTLALMCFPLAFRLASRYAGWPAGVVAAVVLSLAPDVEARWLRMYLEGHASPMSATFTLWAAERHLSGDRRWAMVMATAVALMRPEAWPFAFVYGVWVWRNDAGARSWVTWCAAAVPLLWFGLDYWGSGSFWHGAEVAQVVFDETPDRVALAQHRALTSVIVPVWFLAAFASWTGWRRAEWPLVVAGLGALAWSVLVVAMTWVFRYAALGRFLLPAVAVLAVLAGIGAVRAVELAPRGAVRLVSTAAMVLLILVWAAPRATWLPTQVDHAGQRAELEAQLFDTIDASGGPTAVKACGPVTYRGLGGKRPALAWKLDLPLHQLYGVRPPGPGVVIVEDPALIPAESPDELSTGRMLARQPPWSVVALSCPETTGP